MRIAGWIVVILALIIGANWLASREPRSPSPRRAPPVISPLPQYAASPNARGVWFICHAVQSPEIFVATLPDSEGRFELVERVKGDAEVVARQELSLSSARPTAAERTPFFADGAESGAIVTNGAFWGRNTPPIEKLVVGDREFTCLWRDHTVLMGFTERETFVLTVGEPAISFGGGGTVDAGILVWFFEYDDNNETPETAADARNVHASRHRDGGVPMHSEGVIRFDFPYTRSESSTRVSVQSNVGASDVIALLAREREISSEPIIALQVGENLNGRP